jgi:maltose-binding protein MalE
MTRKRAVSGQQLVVRYRVMRGIEHDELKERYEAGAEADLSHWPQDVIAAWVEQGVIAPVKEKRKRGTKR